MYRKSLIYESSSCKLSQTPTDLLLLTFHKCQQIIEVAHMAAGNSHSCVTVCLVYSVKLYSSTVLNQNPSAP